MGVAEGKKRKERPIKNGRNEGFREKKNEGRCGKSGKERGRRYPIRRREEIAQEGRREQGIRHPFSSTRYRFRDPVLSRLLQQIPTPFQAFLRRIKDLHHLQTSSHSLFFIFHPWDDGNWPHFVTGNDAAAKEHMVATPILETNFIDYQPQCTLLDLWNKAQPFTGAAEHRRR
ncbi:hypothetical protein ACFX1Q_038037 [Malus domestica]